jgi:hypothetical protein
MIRITNATRRNAEQLVARTFATADAEQRIAAARRDVDAREVAVEQWFVWFQAGKYSQARAFWFAEIESN